MSRFVDPSDDPGAEDILVTLLRNDVIDAETFCKCERCTNWMQNRSVLVPAIRKTKRPAVHMGLALSQAELERFAPCQAFANLDEFTSQWGLYPLQAAEGHCNGNCFAPDAEAMKELKDLYKEWRS